LEIGKNWRFWYKTSDLEILWVNDHIATAGETTQQESYLYDELALLSFYRFIHCTKLPRALLLMFLHGAVE